MNLEGSKVLLTGSFGALSTDDATTKLEALGAKIVHAVDFDVRLVFAGDEPGPEIDQAMELGLDVRDQDALDAILEGKAPPRAPAGFDEPAFLHTEEPPGYLLDDMSASISEHTRPPNHSNSLSTPKREPRADGSVFEKGATVKIMGGMDGVGVVGEIFWWGPSKFGEGMRAGVSGEGENSHWVDEAHLGWPDDEIAKEVLEAAKEAASFSKGDRVRIATGRNKGAEGHIFWWGESKWGDGMRAGIETDGQDKVWAAGSELEKLESKSEIRGVTQGSSAPKTYEDDDIPF